MGVLIGSAVIPIACCLSWKKCTGRAAACGAIGGLVLGVGFWLLTAYLMTGDVSVASTAKDLPMLIGNLASIGSSGFILLVMSLLRPDSYDWESMQKISMVDPDDECKP
jgi:urea-proton symporter